MTHLEKQIEIMDYPKTPTIIDPKNNNNSSHHHRKKKKRRTTTTTTSKRQSFPSSSLTLKDQSNPLVITDNRDFNSSKSHIDEHSSLKNPFSWTKKWTKWFSSCGNERAPHSNINFILVSSLSLLIISFRRTITMSRTNSMRNWSERCLLNREEK